MQSKKRRERRGGGGRRDYHGISVVEIKEKSQMATKKRKTKKWSRKVTEHSDALDLEKGVFAGNDAKKKLPVH